jgi:hypothetical protein
MSHDVGRRLFDNVFVVFLKSGASAAAPAAQGLLSGLSPPVDYRPWAAAFLMVASDTDYISNWLALAPRGSLELTSAEDAAYGTADVNPTATNLLAFFTLIEKVNTSARSETADFWLSTLALWGGASHYRAQLLGAGAAMYLSDPGVSLLALLTPLFSQNDPLNNSSTAATMAASSSGHDDDLAELLHKLSMLEGPGVGDAVRAVGDNEWGVGDGVVAAETALVRLQRMYPEDTELAHAAEMYVASLPPDSQL